MIYVGIENDSITLTVPIPDGKGKAVCCDMTIEGALEIIESLKKKIEEMRLKHA